MVLMRHEIGDVLRDYRLQKGMTLRQVAGGPVLRWGTSAKSSAARKKRVAKSWPPLPMH